MPFRKILYSLLLVVFINVLVPFELFAESIPEETSNSELVEREFDKEKLEKAKKNPDFQYDINRKAEEPSWFDKLMYRIVGFLLKVLFNPTGSADSILFYVVCTVLIVLLILIIMRMNAIGIFARRNAKDRDGLDFSELSEDINSIDFDKMIEEAVRSGMYRRAVRLYYLKSLKTLSDREHIVWEINKTNRDYMYELKNAQLRTGFEDVTYLYEYVWYGNAEIDGDKFSRIRNTFNQFSTLIAAAR